MPVIVAIDGPAGSGKSTLARALAKELDLPYVNTGLMYRALTRAALDDSVGVADERALVELARALNFSLAEGATGGPYSLSINAAIPGAELESDEVEANVSEISRHPAVRRFMAVEQRRLGENGAVMEGRDIGSVIFPAATVKFLLTGSAQARVARRVDERDAEDPDRLGEELVSRDSKDSQVNPFVPAADAIEIDTTELSAEQVFDKALTVVKNRLAGSE